MNIEYDMTRKCIPQGDVTLIPIMDIPEGLTLIKSDNGQFIVAHSETGHHHTVMERPDITMYKGMDMFRDFLKVENTPTELFHLRTVHNHKEHVIPVGSWIVQRQAKYTPEGWKKAVD
jgi:hypothetical protein